MSPSTLDQRVRLAAFDWLAAQRDAHGEVLPWSLLAKGLEYDRRRVPLLSQQGIFKPRLCELPLSIRTSPEGPYSDELRSDGTVRYAYRGTNPAMPQAPLKDDERVRPMFYATFSFVSSVFAPTMASSAVIS
jgi:hypothetical protein